MTRTADGGPRRKSWLFPFAVLMFASAAMLASFYFDRQGMLPKFGEKPMIGHITRAYGTVKHMPVPELKWGRLETGRGLLVPLRLGDQLQTGEDSAAEILFFGGATLQLEPGTVARFEEDGDQIALRMILGHGFLELPDYLMSSQLSFHRSDGKVARIPKGKHLVLSLSAAQRMEDAVQIQLVETDRPDASDNLEMRFLAHGEEVGPRGQPLLVPPLDPGDELHGLGQEDAKARLALIERPRRLFPEREAEVDIEANPNIAITWDKVAVPGSGDDRVVAYEVVVKPAFNYEVQDTARRYQVLKVRPKSDKELSLAMEKIGGGGVFLWSVRAVLASGKRGPASTKRWLEIRFPKQLMAPEILKPQIE